MSGRAGESFVVDGTELGIDRQRSHFHVIGAGTEEVRLDAKIVGDREIHERLTAWLPDESDAEHYARPWAWTLYPPELYIRDCPLRPAEPAGAHEGQVCIEDLDDIEVFFYATSHHDVDDVTLRVAPEGLTVRGVVCLQGGRLPFAIFVGTE